MWTFPGSNKLHMRVRTIDNHNDGIDTIEFVKGQKYRLKFVFDGDRIYYSVNGEWIDGRYVNHIEPVVNGKLWASDPWYPTGPHNFKRFSLTP